VSKRGQDTEWDASHGMEEILEFCFKEFAAVCLFWNFFVLWSSNNITYHPKGGYAYYDNSILFDTFGTYVQFIFLFLCNTHNYTST